MRTLTVTFSYDYKEETKTFDFELSTETADEVRQAIAESLSDEENEVKAKEIELTDAECQEDIGENSTLDKIFAYAEAYSECDQDTDVVTAALNCDIQGSDIDEAYSGTYSSDEDFARDMADQLGAIDKNASWPMNCIDWEYAAKELMYDYCEDGGHYFRNL